MLSRSPARPGGRCGQDRWLPRRAGPGSRSAESQRRRPVTMGETPGPDPRSDGPDPAANAAFAITAILGGVRTRVMSHREQGQLRGDRDRRAVLDLGPPPRRRRSPGRGAPGRDRRGRSPRVLDELAWRVVLAVEVERIPLVQCDLVARQQRRANTESSKQARRDAHVRPEANAAWWFAGAVCGRRRRAHVGGTSAGYGVRPGRRGRPGVRRHRVRDGLSRVRLGRSRIWDGH